MLHFTEVGKTRPRLARPHSARPHLARPAAIEVLADYARDETGGGRWRPVRVYFAGQRDILTTCPDRANSEFGCLRDRTVRFKSWGKSWGQILGRVHVR
jgi:hypothetical protein